MNPNKPQQIEMSSEQLHVRRTQAAAPGINMGLIYYVLFRHKWLIGGFSLAAIIAAVITYFTYPVVYQSSAKILVRYVMDLSSGPSGGGSEISKPDNTSLMNTEKDIIASYEVAEATAKAIGAEKVLAKWGGGKDLSTAAAMIKNNLTPFFYTRDSVMQVVFAHPDPMLVQPILTEILNQYVIRHIAVHRPIGFFDEFWTVEKDRLTPLLTQTEAELKRIKATNGIISMEAVKKDFAEQISTRQQEMLRAETELAERQAALDEMNKVTPAPLPTTNAPPPVVSFSRLREYQILAGRLEGLLQRQQELLPYATEENKTFKNLGLDIVRAEQAKKKFEEENPDVTALAPATKVAERPIDKFSEKVRIASLEAKMKKLRQQLDTLREKAAAINDTEDQITRLQATKAGLEAALAAYSGRLEQTRVDNDLAIKKMNNITTVEAPVPPWRDTSKRLKMPAKILAGGIFAGIGLAFLIELLLKHSVRHPSEVEGKLGMPLILSIPAGRNGKRFKLKGIKVSKALSRNGPESREVIGAEPPPWDSNHVLRPFYEGLTDRLISYFEVRNLTHKPKLVAVTACAKNAGVSTIAAGLAACLSETGDGNVLLVDMNVEGGVAHHFYQGEAKCGLDELLEGGKRDEARVQSNLYVVSERARGGKLTRILPKRFTDLLPKLKTSDYDYIIFDMPPITQTSETPRLAEFMDMILMVIESEKTNPETVKRAISMLGRSKSKVSTILNKTQSYLPQWLQHEV